MQLVLADRALQVDVLLVDLHRGLLLRLVLPVVHNRVGLVFDGQHNLLGGVPQLGAERQSFEDLRDNRREILVFGFGQVVLLQSRLQVRITHDVAAQKDEVVVQFVLVQFPQRLAQRVRLGQTVEFELNHVEFAFFVVLLDLVHFLAQDRRVSS